MTKAIQWTALAERWARLRPPLRPAPEVVAFMRATIGEGEEQVLMFGATPEVARAFEPVQAVDRSLAMIGAVWPGSGPRRVITLADWLDYPPLARQFRAAVGDGCLNALASRDELRRLLERIDGWLMQGGLFVTRVYARPAEPILMKDLEAVLAGQRRVNFHAFKWLMAMHLAGISAEANGDCGRVAVSAIRDLFLRICADRAAAGVRCGWGPDDIDTIDAYRDSTDAYLFPTTDEFQGLLPSGFTGEWHAVGDYDLAEHCPLWVVRRRG